MHRTLLLALLTTALVSPSAAQDGDGYVVRMNRRFAERSPKAGDPLPAVTAHTETGAPFELTSVRGKLTVLVTGCLT